MREICLILQGITGIRTAILLLTGLAWCVLAAGGEESVFNVENYGARGDGNTDGTRYVPDHCALELSMPSCYLHCTHVHAQVMDGCF